MYPPRPISWQVISWILMSVTSSCPQALHKAQVTLKTRHLYHVTYDFTLTLLKVCDESHQFTLHRRHILCDGKATCQSPHAHFMTKDRLMVNYVFTKHWGCLVFTMHHWWLIHIFKLLEKGRVWDGMRHKIKCIWSLTIKVNLKKTKHKLKQPMNFGQINWLSFLPNMLIFYPWSMLPTPWHFSI